MKYFVENSETKVVNPANDEFNKKLRHVHKAVSSNPRFREMLYLEEGSNQLFKPYTARNDPSNPAVMVDYDFGS
jgi:hypothetical protein